jgi:hypothetical protein
MPEDLLPPEADPPFKGEDPPKPLKGRARTLYHMMRGTAADANRTDTPAVPDRVETVVESVEELRERHANAIRILTANPSLYHVVQEMAYAQVQERYREHVMTSKYKPTWLKPDARRVFYDLETYQLPSDPEMEAMYPSGSTNYFSKQRIGTCVSIDDQGKVECWDEQRAIELKDYLLGFDEIVSFNGMRFDNYVLAGYSRTSDDAQEIVNRTFDLMLHFEYIDGHRSKLDQLCKKYLGVGKLERAGDSKNVPETLRKGNPEDIAWVWKYCYFDTLRLKQLYEAAPVTFPRKKQFFSGMVGSVETQTAEAVSRLLGPQSPVSRSGGGRARERRWRRQVKSAADQFGAAESFFDTPASTTEWNDIVASAREWTLGNEPHVSAFVTQIIRNSSRAFASEPRYMGYPRAFRDSIQRQVTSEVGRLLAAALAHDQPSPHAQPTQAEIGGLVEGVVSVLLSPSSVSRIVNSMQQIGFLDVMYALDTDLGSLDSTVIERDQTIAVTGHDRKRHVITRQLRKGSLQKIAVKVPDHTNIFTDNITGPADADIQSLGVADRIFDLSVDNLVSKGVAQRLVLDGQPSEVAAFLSRAFREKVPGVLEESRRRRLEIERSALVERLAELSSIRIPDGITNLPSWAADLTREREGIERSLRALEGNQNEVKPKEPSAPSESAQKSGFIDD